MRSRKLRGRARDRHTTNTRGPVNTLAFIQASLPAPAANWAAGSLSHARLSHTRLHGHFGCNDLVRVRYCPRENVGFRPCSRRDGDAVLHRQACCYIVLGHAGLVQATAELTVGSAGFALASQQVAVASIMETVSRVRRCGGERVEATPQSEGCRRKTPTWVL